MAQRREEFVLTDVRAPMDGVVRNVRLTTIGGVLRRNLPATVKLDAFDYAIYGVFHGQASGWRSNPG